MAIVEVYPCGFHACGIQKTYLVVQSTPLGKVEKGVFEISEHRRNRISVVVPQSIQDSGVGQNGKISGNLPDVRIDGLALNAAGMPLFGTNSFYLRLVGNPQYRCCDTADQQEGRQEKGQCAL